MQKKDPLVSFSIREHIPKEFEDIHNVWTRTEYLGEGTTGKVYKVISFQDNLEYAAKFIKKTSLNTKNSRMRLQTEVKIHRKVKKHKHVVQFYSFVEIDDHYVIIMECCNKDNLFDLLKKQERFSNDQALTYFRQIVLGLQHIHQQGVVHCDLKLGNIYLDQNSQIKIGDFGLSCECENMTTSRQGTPNYVAPEIVKKLEQSYTIDIWALGIILYTMVVGECPFVTESVESTFRRIRNVEYDIPAEKNVSEKIKDLIASLLKVDPEDRPTLEELLKL